MNNKGFIPILVIAVVAGAIWIGAVANSVYKTRHVPCGANSCVSCRWTIR